MLVTDEIHPKISNHSSNETFINRICKLFEKCIGYERVILIQKTEIVIPPDKKSSIHLKNNYQLVFLTCIFV